MSFSCPSCGSENTQKLSLTHQSGTANLALGSVGIGSGGGHLGVGGGISGGRTQSELARMYAPPKRLAPFGQMGCLFILALIVSPVMGAATNSEAFAFFVMVLFGVGILALIFHAARHNTKIFPQQYAEWEKKFLCLRCGNIFQIKSP